MCVLKVLYKTEEAQPMRLVFTMSFIARFIQIGFFTIYTIRIYFLYYDLEYNEALKDQHWKGVLSDLKMDKLEKQNWFIRNKSTYGNSKYLLKRIIPIWFIISSIYPIISIITYNINYSFWISYRPQWIYQFLIITPLFCIFWVIIWRKCPALHDTIGLRIELLRLIQTLIIASFLFAIGLILSIFAHENISAICYWLLPGTCTAIIYHTTLGVVRYNTKHLPQKKRKNSENVLNGIESSQCNAAEVISHLDGYTAFMRFLFTEFSSENLLFITEYFMFIEALNRNGITVMFDDMNESGFKCKFPQQLPQTSVVKKFEEQLIAHDTFVIDACLDAMGVLLNKYIRNQSAFEINISYLLRNQIVNAYNNKYLNGTDKMNQLLQHLQCATRDILYLMNSSFNRFIRSTEV